MRSQVRILPGAPFYFKYLVAKMTGAVSGENRLSNHMASTVNNSERPMFPNRSTSLIRVECPPKHIRTAADLLRFGAALKMDCCNCGAARTLDGVDVAKAAGAGPLKGLGRRLRCSRCGMKQAKLTVLPPI